MNLLCWNIKGIGELVGKIGVLKKMIQENQIKLLGLVEKKSVVRV